MLLVLNERFDSASSNYPYSYPNITPSTRPKPLQSEFKGNAELLIQSLHVRVLWQRQHPKTSRAGWQLIKSLMHRALDLECESPCHHQQAPVLPL